MIVNKTYIDTNFEWKSETIFTKESEKSYDLFINPQIRNQLIEFYIIEYQCRHDRYTNSYIDRGFNTLKKEEFKQFRKDLENGIEVL